MRVTAVVLTGFLGAGKTTLLNRAIALRAAGAGGGGGKLGIIVNELGAIGVDGELLPRGAARQVELPGGCVCCALNEDLDRTVREMLDAAPEIDMLVIETTGVAEPLPIVWSLETPPLGDRLRVAAVVTVVDPSSFVAARQASPTAEIQVENADVVLLSKTELAAPGEVEAARAAVAQLAPRAPVMEGSIDARATWLLELLGDPERVERLPAAPAHHEHDHDENHHGIDAVALAVDELLDLEELEDALAELPPAYVRVKGIVWARDPRLGAMVEPAWTAVHRVGARVSSERVEKPAAGGRMVALGPGVTAAPLRDGVARAVLSSETIT